MSALAEVRVVVRRSSRAAARLDRDAVRDLVPITLSVMPFALVIGVTVAQVEQVPNWLGLIAGPAIYAGSSQLAAIILLGGGSGLLPVVGAVAMINARLLIYGAVLAPRFRDQPAWFRWLAPHFLVDQTLAASSARPELDDPVRFRRYWLTAGGVLGLGWTLAMAAGVLAGPRLPSQSPLDFAVTAVFVGLLVPRLRDRRSWLPAGVAAVVAVLASPLANGIGLVVAIVVALVVTMLTERDPS